MTKKISNPCSNFPKPPAPNGPPPLIPNDSDICVWCGKSYNEHKDGQTQPVTPRVPCLMLKQGFVHKSQAGLRLTKDNLNKCLT